MPVPSALTYASFSVHRRMKRDARVSSSSTDSKNACSSALSHRFASRSAEPLVRRRSSSQSTPTSWRASSGNRTDEASSVGFEGSSAGAEVTASAKSLFVCDRLNRSGGGGATSASELPGETYPARLGLPRSPSSNRNPFGGTSFPQYRARTHRIRALERTTCARAPSVMGASAFALARSSAESTSVS